MSYRISLLVVFVFVGVPLGAPGCARPRIWEPISIEEFKGTIPRPTVVERPSETESPPRLSAGVQFKDDVDPRAYGFDSLAAMKTTARKALGLPANFPLAIRQEVSQGKKGVVFAGPSPRLVDRQGRILSIQEMVKLPPERALIIRPEPQ